MSTGISNQGNFDENGSLIVSVREFFKLIWTSATSFNKGDYTNTQVSGGGDAAGVELLSLSPNSDDVTYAVIGDFTLSDGAKLDIAGGNARLKQLSGESEAWHFTTPSKYTYDTDFITLAASEATLVDQRPANATFYANYEDDIDGNWGDGNLTGTSVGGAGVSGGELVLDQDDLRYVSYSAVDNSDFSQTGCVRIGVIPNYTGSPSGTRTYFTSTRLGTTDSEIRLLHLASGNVSFRIRTSGHVNIFEITAAWSPTAGVPAEIELNYDLTSGAHRLLIDGVTVGTDTTTGVRGTVADVMYIGTNYTLATNSDFNVGYVICFDEPQHTADYTPVGESGISSTIYPLSDPTIEPVTPMTFSSPVTIALETSTTPANTGIQHQVSSDGGTTIKWWDTSAWVPITTALTQTVPTSISTVAGTYDSGDLASVQTLDANTYDVSENAGPAPNLRVDMGFSSIQGSPGQVTLHVGYSGSLSHIVNVDIYNFVTVGWDTLGQIPDNLGIITQYNFAVTGTKSDYLSAGVVDIRINHTSNGNSGHDLFIDYAYVLLDVDPSDTWYYDNESNDIATIQTNIPTLAVSGTLWWKSFLHTSDGDVKPDLHYLEFATDSTFSTDDNLYVDTKDVSHIAPATIVSWNNSQVTQVNPASTDIRFMVSVDGRVSWLSWDGLAWSIPASATLRANATEFVAYATNFSSLPLGDGTFDVRVFIYTSLNTSTPAVSNIHVGSSQGIATSGDWEGNAVSSGFSNNDWGKVGISSVVPVGTVVLQLRAANDLVSLAATSYGPAVVDGDDAGVIGQYIQPLLTFTGDAAETPLVNEISFEYMSPTTENLDA